MLPFLANKYEYKNGQNTADGNTNRVLSQQHIASRTAVVTQTNSNAVVADARARRSELCCCPWCGIAATVAPQRNAASSAIQKHARVRRSDRPHHGCVARRVPRRRRRSGVCDREVQRLLVLVVMMTVELRVANVWNVELIGRRQFEQAVVGVFVFRSSVSDSLERVTAARRFDVARWRSADIRRRPAPGVWRRGRLVIVIPPTAAK